MFVGVRCWGSNRRNLKNRPNRSSGQNRAKCPENGIVKIRCFISSSLIRYHFSVSAFLPLTAYTEICQENTGITWITFQDSWDSPKKVAVNYFLFFHKTVTSAHWIWVGYNHFISNKCDWNNGFISMPTKLWKFYHLFYPISMVKTTNFHSVYFWADTYTYHIWSAWFNGSYTMIACIMDTLNLMAKPLSTLELHHDCIISWLSFNHPRYLFRTVHHWLCLESVEFFQCFLIHTQFFGPLNDYITVKCWILHTGKAHWAHGSVMGC